MDAVVAQDEMDNYVDEPEFTPDYEEEGSITRSLKGTLAWIITVVMIIQTKVSGLQYFGEA